MPRILPALVGLPITVAAVVAVVSGNSTPTRAPERTHYARLAALDPTAAPARARLDARTFSLDRWGDLYNWRLVKRHYVTVPLDALTAVKPPANSSPQTRAELDYLLGLQKNRTEQEREWCLKLAEIYHHPLLSNPADPRYRPNRDNLFFVGRDLGPWFRQDNLPKTTELLARVYRDAMVYIVELKLRYARPRPHHLEPQIKADDKTIPHASFPSGHSFASYINAGVLSRLAPTRRSDLLAKAHELAWSRELLGVHYPSDTEAGRVLAEDFVRFLFESADFVREFEGVQREWQERSVTNQ
jgi:acid phosphatase (class A)